MISTRGPKNEPHGALEPDGMTSTRRPAVQRQERVLDGERIMILAEIDSFVSCASMQVAQRPVGVLRSRRLGSVDLPAPAAPCPTAAAA